MSNVAIITGAGRGIGRAAALELSRRGWNLALVARTAAELQEVAARCSSGVLIAPADVTDEPALAKVVSNTADRFGRVDAVVNNAGLAPQAGVAETDTPLFERVIATNLTAALTLSRLAWPHLLRAGGTLVHVSSLAAIDPLPGFVAYAAAKAGLHGLSAALANEGRPHGIRSTVLVIGGVETAMFRGLKGTEGVPADALMTPEEVGTAIADCIAGPFRYSSGQVIYLRK